ncbi:MAG: fibronectin type III domain-containing protein [Melioribacteraceae bacterium]|nr:fibronectin type III domain-containing protein [Melioribacteraceae bacterium]
MLNITDYLHSFIFSIILLFFILILIFLTGCEKEKAPIFPRNNPPFIISVIAEPDTLLINETSILTCTAIDDDNDKLSITWSSEHGSFRNGNIGSGVKWMAPSTPGSVKIIVKVSDGKATIEREIEIAVGKIPSKPILSKPIDSTQEISLTAFLIWNSVSEARSYDLQLSTDSLFSAISFYKSGITGTLQKVSELKSKTIYYWRIRSRNEFGKSIWSKIFSFRTTGPPESPRLASPVNESKNISLNPFLIWSELKNADSYTIHVSSTESFYDTLYYESELKDTLLQITGLSHFATYYWRVSASNNRGTSDWSKAGVFSTIGRAPYPPILLTPENKSRNIPHSTSLIWKMSEYSESYSLQVAEDSSFTNLIYDQKGLTSSSSIISNLDNTKTYYWRVDAYNSYGNSGWSDARSFTTLLLPPALYLPVNDAVDVSPSPVVSWQQIDEANSYSLQISDDSLFTKVIFDETGISGNSRGISGLKSYTKYFWRVSAENDIGISTWSGINSFNVSAYFYKGYPYGNQALYNPMYLLLNGGFDMIQVGNKRDIKNFPYKIAIKNIWKNLSDPFTPINNYGWWNFIKDQVLPLSLDKKNAQFWPNYTLHLIGGGMEYAAMKEWFEYYNYPYPQWLSAFTVMTYHLINEVAENGNYVGDDVDPIADIYIFDIGGILLFTSESVKRFFAEDLNLADWSQQPSFSLRNGELHNNGHFFSVKWKFPFSDSWHAFYYFGTNGVGGLSYKFQNGSAISVGLGLAASDLILLDEKTNKKTLGLVGNLGVFYDRNNSLLASLSITIKTDYMINLNIYPGLIKIGDISPGIWGAYSQDGNVICGLAFSWLPFGAAYSLK